MDRFNKVINFSGPWGENIPVNISFTKNTHNISSKVFNTINMRIPAIIMNIEKNENSIRSIIKSVDVLDKEYCPTHDSYFPVYVTNISNDCLGSLKISIDGYINIYSDTKEGTFSIETGRYGIYDTEIEYS